MRFPHTRGKVIGLAYGKHVKKQPKSRAIHPEFTKLCGICCSVILTRMSADEQLARYSCHVEFQSLGLEGVNEELTMKLGHISSGNLSPDGRVIGDHGKEARSLFLHESVMCGAGEKHISYLAAIEVCLPALALLSKRAMQFGSRIAKLEKINEKGSDKCRRLQILP
ncbi:asparagine synthetase domain-containing protein 1-like [Peromyscus leucopus]|uniref:asparagine synthetase domain-containing protein 1-like n=1 Tax=Peromyscus leucopus TaxID=10041 RepID=UPI0010A10872|nr:asparagine synthetase domain-containing protein 1-like [Peromyscus leucopus]